LNDPVAVNCWVFPRVTDESRGVIATDVRVPVPTVRVVVPLIPAELAETVTVPAFLPWARPEPRTWAIFGFEDFHDKPLRLLEVLPSLNVPTAVNFSVVPFSIRGLLGLMLMDTRWAVETVKVVDPLIAPSVAEIVVVPVARLPTEPRLFMVAVAGLEEPQRTESVRSCVLLSLKVPVAVNCLVVPTAILEFAGVTAIDTNAALLTLSEAVPVTEPEIALMVDDPVPTAVARPEGLMVAVPGSDDVHVTDVKSCVLPSSKVPTALNCCSVPRAIATAFGSTSMDIRCAGTTVRVVVSLRDPTVAVIVVCPAPAVVATPEPLILTTELEEELQVTPLARSCVDPSE
jgi:hypothetical protein